MSVTWVRFQARQWALLPGALVALGCATDPDGVASVAVTPSTLSFATIHAPAETITVTVTGTNGRIRTDIPVTWTFWESSGDPIATSRVIVIQRAANSANRWTVRPFGEPGVSFYYANAGGQRTPPLSAAVWAGPPVALKFDRQPPPTAQGGVPIPFLISVLTVDADGFPTSSEVPVTVTIASGNGTLAGTTTVNTRSGSAGFSNLIIQGSGAFTLRFSSPGLTSVDSNPISVTGSAISAIR